MIAPGQHAITEAVAARVLAGDSDIAILGDIVLVTATLIADMPDFPKRISAIKLVSSLLPVEVTRATRKLDDHGL